MTPLNVGNDLREVKFIQDGMAVITGPITFFQSGMTTGASGESIWQGEIHLHRTSPDLEIAIANDPLFFIMTVINEKNTSRTTVMYAGARLVVKDAGEWESGSFVTQVVTFTAEKRTITRG